jgi:Histidine kinase-like ATPase domain
MAASQRDAAPRRAGHRPASARAHVHAVLPAWHQAGLADDTAAVVSELVTNAVQASTTPTGEPAYTGGRIAVVRLRLLGDGQRVLAEVWDQAPGFPVPRRAGSGDENGRGLQLVNALTRGRWGWQPVGSQSKIVWAELSAELPGLLRCQRPGAEKQGTAGRSACAKRLQMSFAVMPVRQACPPCSRWRRRRSRQLPTAHAHPGSRHRQWRPGREVAREIRRYAHP